MIRVGLLSAVTFLPLVGALVLTLVPRRLETMNARRVPVR